MISEQSVVIDVRQQLILEARLAVPASPGGGIVVCHPHPLYGGDMDNPVVVRVQEVCAELGLATLRFNFRSVGGSTGSHANGVGEQDDAVAALDVLAKTVGDRPLAIAGYSFGARVAALVAGRDTLVSGVALIAPPLTLEVPWVTSWRILFESTSSRTLKRRSKSSQTSLGAVSWERRVLPG